MSAVIYGIRTDHNSKVYVGSTNNFSKRVGTHLRQLSNGVHHNAYLQRVYDKYGADNLLFFIIEYVVNAEELLQIEDYYINANITGYNIADACGGDNFTNNPNKEYIREKISTGLNNYYNTLTDEEKKQKYGRFGSDNPNWKGGVSKKLCPKCEINEISSRNDTCFSCRDISKSFNPFYGKKHSEETKQKLREANLGRKHSEKTKQKITGENSSRFKGYYHTPWGIFPSSSLAQKNHEYLLSATIHRWCLNSDKIIIKQAVSRSRFLKQLPESPIGKTYRTIGFWFEPKQP